MRWPAASARSLGDFQSPAEPVAFRRRSFSEEVALAVERIVRASRAATLAAFDGHFDRIGRRSPRDEAMAPRTTPVGQRPKIRTAPPHRSDEELEALEAQFLAAVRSNPGQTMSVLAAEVGAKPAELRVPVVRLRARKQVKLVGRRQFACYFPVDDDIDV